MFNRIVGIKETTYEEGTHFMVPWFDHPIVFDVRTRPRQIQSLTGSKGELPCSPCAQLVPLDAPYPRVSCITACADLQMVQITLRVLTRPNPDRLPTIYREIGIGACLSSHSRFCLCHLFSLSVSTVDIHAFAVFVWPCLDVDSLRWLIR